MNSVFNVILVGLGGATFVVACMSLQATRRQPLAESELKATEKLADLANTTKRALLDVPHGYGADKEESNKQLANILSSWEEGTARLEQRIGADLNGRVASLTLLMEAALRLELVEDLGWVVACSWSCSDISQAAEARMQRRKQAVHLFPSTDELRQLLGTGQSLGTGLDELSRWCNENVLRVIADEKQKDRKRDTLAGAGMAAGVLLLLWGVAETLR